MNKRGATTYDPDAVNVATVQKSRPPWVLIAAIIFFVIVILIGILIAINFISFKDGKLILGGSKGLELKEAYVDGESIRILIGMGSENENITGIEFIFEKDDDNLTIRRDVVFDESKEVSFVFTSSDFPGITSYEKVSVSPIYPPVSEKGEEVVGEVEDTKKISPLPPGGGGGGGSESESSGETTDNTTQTNETVEFQILNSVSGNSLITDDLIATSPSVSGYSNFIYDWRKNNVSMAVLNMPFDTNVSSSDTWLIRDYTSSPGNGTLGGGNDSRRPVWTTGVNGGAYEFDGIDDYIGRSGDSAGVEKHFSGSAWVYPKQQKTQQIMSCNYLADFGFRVTSSNALHLFAYQNYASNWTAYDLQTSNGVVPLNQWSHVAFTVNDSSLRIYLNGVLIKSGPSSTPFIATGSGTCNIGYFASWYPAWFNGTIDEVQIYNRTLSSEQIAAMYNNGVPKYDILVSEETGEGDSWSVAVTPNNINGDGITNFSNSLTVSSSGGSSQQIELDNPWAPSGLTANVISNSRVDLNWGSAYDDIGVTGYKIFRDGTEIASISGTSYSDTGLNSDTRYVYTVSAFDAAGNESKQSAEDVVITTTSYSCDVTFSPGDSVASTVSSSPEGTVFCFNPGTYRHVSITPKNNMVFIGGEGVILSGAKLIDPNDFVFSGGFWQLSGQTQDTYDVEGTARCDYLDVIDFLNTSGMMPFAHPLATQHVKYDACDLSEDMFFDDIALWRVKDMSYLGSGSWLFDEANDTMYLSDDPAGHTIETSVTEYAFRPTAVNNVKIMNFTIEKYAQTAQTAPIYAGYGDGWVVENNLIRWNHGTGVRIGNTSIIRNNYVHHNGQMGVSGVARQGTVLVEDNEIAYNQIRGYSYGWEDGGTKFVITKDLVVRNNYVHHNGGPGLWTDIGNINSTFEGNIVEWNARDGIVNEISYDTIIRDNLIRYNGYVNDGWLWGSQILIQNSPNGEIYNNTVVMGSYGNGISIVNQNRGNGTYGPYTPTNNYFHHNNVTYLDSHGYSGVVSDYCEGNPCTHIACTPESNNLFDLNTYIVPNVAGARWTVCGIVDWTGFQAEGFELNGTLYSNT